MSGERNLELLLQNMKPEMKDGVFVYCTVADNMDIPTGCPFRTRCPQAQAKCEETPPQLESHDMSDRLVACHFPELVGAPPEGSHSEADPATYQGHPEPAQ